MSESIQHLPAELCSLYHLLRQPRRCYLVLYMARGDPPHDVDTLARQVAGKINDTSPPNVPWDEYKNVIVSLRQTHIPALCEQDVVRADDQHKQLTPGSQFNLAVMLIHIGNLLWLSENTAHWSPPEDTEMTD